MSAGPVGWRFSDMVLATDLGEASLANRPPRMSASALVLVQSPAAIEGLRYALPGRLAGPARSGELGKALRRSAVRRCTRLAAP
jgi:hypothetical protein